MGWGSSTRGGGCQKVRSLPRWVLTEGTWDVPGILPGCPRPLGGSKSLCKTKFVPIFSFPIGVVQKTMENKNRGQGRVCGKLAHIS